MLINVRASLDKPDQLPTIMLEVVRWRPEMNLAEVGQLIGSTAVRPTAPSDAKIQFERFGVRLFAFELIK